MSKRSTKNRETSRLIKESAVSASVPGPTSLREVIVKLANSATLPLKIESLADELSEFKFIRGSAYHGYLADQLEELAENIPNLRWWITQGRLTMAVVGPEETISSFDVIAGPLYDRYQKDGKVSKADLAIITSELDARISAMGMNFLDCFERKTRTEFADYNRKYARSAIKSFQRAIAVQRFVRHVRQRLCRARERYLKARASGT